MHSLVGRTSPPSCLLHHFAPTLLVPLRMALFKTVYLFVAANMFAGASNPDPSNDIPEIGATVVLIDDGGCSALCSSTGECANDPHHHGSYCKFWQSPAVCFGLYSQNTTANATGDLCFQPNNGSCDDSVLPPVLCPEQTNTTCALLCSITPSCIGDPNNHGSFCKLDTNVCFGLYWTNSSKSEACFQPNDPNCPSTFPVACTGETIGTTSFPTTITSASTGTLTETLQTQTTGFTTEQPQTQTESMSSSSEVPV